MRKSLMLFVSLSFVALVGSYLVDSRFGFGLVDDAYISMRYARNWADGIGPFFNPGERVEGYTNFLWTFFLYWGARLGLDPPWMATFLGRICVGLTIPVTFFLAWELCGTWVVAALAGILLVTDAGWWAWCASGLETPLLTLFFVASFAIWLRESKSLRDWIVLSALAVCAALTRPEGGAVFLFVLVAEMVKFPPLIPLTSEGEGFSYDHPQQSGGERGTCDPSSQRSGGAARRTRLGNLAILLGMFIGIYLPYLLWRRWTYGLWLPNSFYAKHGFAGVMLYGKGAVYVCRVFAAHPLWAVVFLGAATGGWRDKRFRLLFLFAVFFLGVVILSGGDHYTLGRFCAPLIPILSILTAAGFQRASTRISVLGHLTKAPPWRTALIVAIIFGGMLLGKMNLFWTFSYRDEGHFHCSEVKWAEAWGRVGLLWREELNPGTVIAVITAGALPYASRLPTIDILGINDHHISQRDLPIGRGVPGHEKGDAAYVMKRRPQRVQIAPMLLFQQHVGRYTRVNLEDVLRYPAQLELVRNPVFRASYEYVTVHTRFGYLSYHRYRGKGRSQ